jgi:Flp pilus assembly protein TadB
METERKIEGRKLDEGKKRRGKRKRKRKRNKRRTREKKRKRKRKKKKNKFVTEKILMFEDYLFCTLFSLLLLFLIVHHLLFLIFFFVLPVCLSSIPFMTMLFRVSREI